MNRIVIGGIALFLLFWGFLEFNLQSKLDDGSSRKLDYSNNKENATDKEIILPENRLSNGELIQRNSYYMDQVAGDHRITIDNTNGSSDAIVKFLLKNTSEASFEVKVITMCIREGQRASVDSLPNGNYRIAFAYVGGYNYGTSKPLGVKGTQIADEVYSMWTENDGNYLISKDLTITLYKVSNGNLQTESITSNEFNNY